MPTEVTYGIRISVRSHFEAAHSDPRAFRYLFTYRITITNTGRDTVKLLRRHWIIRDSMAATREVEGPGVVGETPVIVPGASHSYVSACDLRSGMGRMEGTYLMERVEDGRRFHVGIPPFELLHPALAN